MAVVLLQPLVFLLQPPKPALVVPPVPASRGQLCCCAGLTAPPYSNLWQGHPSTHPQPLLFCGDGSLTPQPNQSTLVLPSVWASTAASSQDPRHPLPRPRRRPPPWCSRHGVVNVVKERLPSEETVRGEADGWVHDRSKEVPPY